MSELIDYPSEIVAHVEYLVKPAGFAAMEVPGWFARVQAVGWLHAVLLVVTGEKSRCELSVRVALRSERVEQLFHQTSGFALADRINTFTLGVDCSLLCPSAPHQLVVTNLASLEQANLACKHAFEECAEPVFNELSSLEAIDAIVNGNLATPCIFRPHPWFRASTGLIVAKLVKRANYDDVVKKYTELVGEFSKGFYLARFRGLVEILSNLADE